MEKIQSAQSSFFRRGIGFFIDFIILLFVQFAVLQKLFSASVNISGSKEGMVTEILYRYPENALFFVVFLTLYFIVFETLFARTIGKFITGQKVTNSLKQKAAFTQIVIRNVFKIVDLFVGSVVFLFSRKNQTIGDMVARTFVIRNKEVLPLTDLPSSKVRKVFGVLFILFLLTLTIATIAAIPKIKVLNSEAVSIVKGMQTDIAIGDYNGVYETFIPEYRFSVTYEEFLQTAIDSKLFELIKALNIDNTNFYAWQFNKNQAILLGDDTMSETEINMIKGDDGIWRLITLAITNPAIE